MVRWRPLLLAAAAAAAVALLLGGGRPAQIVLALLGGGLPAALMSAGIGRGPRRAPLIATAVALGLWVVFALLAMTALAGRDEPVLLGLRPAAALVVLGLWLLPLLPATLVFGLGLDRFLGRSGSRPSSG
jgi:hypothetical protein